MVARCQETAINQDAEQAMDLSEWTGVARPDCQTLEGRYVRLEKLDPSRHGASLLEASRGAGAEERFRYLPDRAPADPAEMASWLATAAASTDPLFFAVIDRATGRAEGCQALMRIDAANGVIEIGNILWGPSIARTRVATEALHLFARHVFDTLGYRRLEWKCNHLNEPSKRAALRFGFAFEGRFRQHMVVKGANRDTAWFAIIDADWPRLRAGYETWLQPANFDESGQQRRRLTF